MPVLPLDVAQALRAVPVPPTGHVLFVATLPDEALDEAAVDDLLMVLHGFADAAAPGRSSVVAVAQGCSLELLTDEQLAGAGLQRIPVEAVEPRLPSEADVLREGKTRTVWGLPVESAHVRMD